MRRKLFQRDSARRRENRVQDQDQKDRFHLL